MKKKSEKKNEPSQEFLEKKELMEMQEKNNERVHGFRMRELEMIRSTEVYKHERAMERQRIKSAEIRKAMLSKDAFKRH